MAKRIQFRAHGGPEVLEYVDYQPAEPGPQQVRVRNQAIGLNFIDTYYRGGLYPLPELPSGLGNEGAGVVDAVGSEVRNVKVGDRVAYGTGPLGAYSQLHVLPAANVVKLPEDISFEQAAAVMLKGLTTQYLLRQTYELKGGETILFHAAAGGVGSIACQWAKALDVKLIGTVSSGRKSRTRQGPGRMGNHRLQPRGCSQACTGIDRRQEVPGGLRRCRQGHLVNVIGLRGATGADGQLWQCLRRGNRGQSGDFVAEGFAVCDPADTGVLRQ
jgi:D-arabinose 1-dehydrogenase-like Zn-dependent alcohol dehydrogenase